MECGNDNDMIPSKDVYGGDGGVSAMLCTSSYFLSASSAISLAWASCASSMPTLSSSMFVRFSSAFRILKNGVAVGKGLKVQMNEQHLIMSRTNDLRGICCTCLPHGWQGHKRKVWVTGKRRKILKQVRSPLIPWKFPFPCFALSFSLLFFSRVPPLWFRWPFVVSRVYQRVARLCYPLSLDIALHSSAAPHRTQPTYRSLSSAAAEASDSLAVADAKRSSERSRSSSSS